MEPVVGELLGLNVGSSNLLGLPNPCPSDSDDELLGIGGIKPKSSPIPRRRSSLSCSEDDSQPPPSSSRRVSFADTFGLSLVSVKQFDTWSMCDPTDPLEVDLKDAKEYFLKLLFALPQTLEELLYRVQEQKVDLESLELLPGTTTLKGIVRVLNLCFDKLVYIRTSLDCWSSHFDLLAEYMPDSSQGVTDCFSFKLTLVPPFGEQGARVDFCIRYETPFGTFWANHSGQNYVLFCHEKAREQDESEKLTPKSCLKPSRHSSMTSTTSNAEEIPEITLNCGSASITEPVGVKDEKIQEEHMSPKEENSKNYSRRSKRKAARMAKLQQYFTQRDEKDLQQTDKDTDEVDVPGPTIDEAPLNLSTPQRNVASLLAEPSETEGQKSIAGSIDVERNQRNPTTQTQTQERDNILVIHPDVITSKSQTKPPPLNSINSQISLVDSQLLENNQDKETVHSQISDKSIGKTVEKAWECFEKCAMERIGGTAETNSSVSKSKHVDSKLLENNQGYTFETIVAPLYHQVFKRMENDRRGMKDSASKVDDSVGKLDDGSLKVVTYPSVETRSNPETSAQHVDDDDYHGACKETCPEYLHNTDDTAKNALSVLNVKAKHGAEIAFQDTALPDITDNQLDDNISESKTALPTDKHSSNSQPLVYWEESTTGQIEQTPGIVSVDEEYSPNIKPPCSGYSLNNIQQELICTDSDMFPRIPQSEDRAITQASFETRISDEISKMQDKEAQLSGQTLNTHIKSIEEGYTPMSDSTLLCSDISSNATPSSFSQDLPQATIQPQIPATIFFTQSLVNEAIVPQLQTIDDTNLIQKTMNTSQNSDHSHHVGSETESNISDRTDGVDTETIEKEIQISPAMSAVVKTSPDFIDVSDNKEYRISHVNVPDDITDLDEILVKDMVISNISNDHDNPEHASQEEEGVKEHDQVSEKNREQELSDMMKKQSEEVYERREVEKLSEEKEEEQQVQVEKEELESNKKAELGNEDKIKNGSYNAEDDDVIKDNKNQDAEPRRNGLEWKEEKDLEAELEDQEMVAGGTSMATLQTIPNIDSLITEVHLHVRQEQQNTNVEQMSEEPVSEMHSTGGTDSSQQALTLKSEETSSDQIEEVENNSEFIDREKHMGCQIDKEDVAEDTIGEVEAVLEKQERNCLNEPSETMDDSASTESLTDDEMELCLLRLKNTPQSGLKDAIFMGKRLSISRTRTIPSPMPSISEHMDEDQPNALLDDLTNEEMIELETASLPRLDKQEEVIEPNLLWWREFFSSDNMPKMIVYSLLLLVFVITAYLCDFIACFGLYLLALYWLYFQVQREPLKGT